MTNEQNQHPAVEPTVEAVEENAMAPDLEKDVSEAAQDNELGEVRHMLVGSPEGIQKVMDELQKLNYADSESWSPVEKVADELVFTKELGEATSSLRRTVEE